MACGSEDHRLGGHQAAGRVGLVGEQAADRLGLVGIHRAEQLLLARGGKLAEQVGRVVGLHLVEHATEPLEVEALDQPHLLVLGELLEQVGQPLVLERLRQHAPAAERQLPDRGGHLGRMQAAERGGLAVDGPLVGEQLAGLAPVDHLGGAPQAGEPRGCRARPSRPPRRTARGRGEADVDDALLAQPAADQLAGHQALAGAQLELTQVDRPAAQAHAVGGRSPPTRRRR